MNIPAVGVSAEVLSIPVSFGELVDKLTILHIKSERIADVEKQGYARHERALLQERLAPHIGDKGEALEVLTAELCAVNLALWDVEDRIRQLETAQDFGPDFIAAARSVYITNDERYLIKSRINDLFSSGIREVKSYG